MPEISVRHSYFYKNHLLEKVSATSAFPPLRFVIIHCLANDQYYRCDLYCIHSLIYNRAFQFIRAYIFRSRLFSTLHLEYYNYLVDLECIDDWGMAGHFCKQFAHVHSMDGLSFYEQTFWCTHRLFIIYYFLAVI